MAGRSRERTARQIPFNCERLLQGGAQRSSCRNFLKLAVKDHSSLGVLARCYLVVDLRRRTQIKKRGREYTRMNSNHLLLYEFLRVDSRPNPSTSSFI